MSSTRPARPSSAAAPTADSTGTYRAHPRGFGFVDLTAPVAGPVGEVRSCFVPPPLTKGLLSDDSVSVTLLLEDDGRATATTLTRTGRSRTTVFGVVVARESGALGLRVDPHVGHGEWQLKGRLDGVAIGNAVQADVTGDRTADPTDIWDDPTWPDAVIGRVLARQRIVEDYPEGLMQAQRAWVAAHPAADEVARRDLRSTTTFTIDSPSSRDLDDALSVYPADPDGGLRICVHIADVAAHVPAGSPLDTEALRSGTSVYLPDWTRPMLPAELSEDALSLLPGVDRDVLTVEMRLDESGAVTSADVYAARIRTTARLSYEQAADVLAGRETSDVPAEVVDALRWLRTAAARLGVQRQRRGGVDARRIEPELIVGVVDGEAIARAAAPSNPANLLIERLMVAANESVAAWLVARGLPGMFRVHPAPDPKASAALETFCAAAGYHPGFGEHLTPLGLAALSAQLEGSADETAAAVWDVLLGFLGRASYTPSPGAHFGLASPAYLHFTSPIRRAADLTVHRIIRSFLSGQRGPTAFPGREEMQRVADHLNIVSGTAARAEAQTRKALWLVTLAEQQAAEPEAVLTGRVTGVNAKGAFVSLDSSHVSGFLPAKELPGRGWTQTDDGLALISATGKSMRFGDPVRVRLALIDVESGTLEMTPADRPARNGAGRSRAR